MQVIDRLEDELQETIEKNSIDCSWMRSFIENRNMQELTRELVVTLIDRIEVCEDKSLRW